MQRYDLTAEIYEERYAEEQKAKYEAALKNVDASGGVVLDAGCGTGLFFSHIAGKANAIVGVDISRKLLLKARKQAESFENSFVLQADVDWLPFKEEVFSAVFAFTVLQNVPDPSKTLIELRRVAKPDGKIVLTGLKKAFPKTKFIGLLEKRAFKIISFLDNADLKCYVAVLSP